MTSGSRDIPAALDAEEAAFVAQLQAGEESAFDRLVREYGGRLLAVARRMLRNEEDAREALQEGLLSAFRNLSQFSGGSRIYTWLHRVVVNAALMRLRKRRQSKELSIEPLLPGFLKGGHQTEPASRWEESAESALQRDEIRQLVREGIDRLPEKYRTVLLLRDIEGLDTEETARLLELNEATVKTRVHRARQALRSLLDSEMRGSDS